MAYTVVIRNNITGEVRTGLQPYEWEDDEDGGGQLFWWTEGNFGCDCNRSLEFARAGGATEEEAWDAEVECGETVFSVPHVILADGTQISVDSSWRGRDYQETDRSVE
jgi:hypothetical protein